MTKTRPVRSGLARLGEPLFTDDRRSASTGRALLGLLRVIVEWPTVLAEWFVASGLRLSERIRSRPILWSLWVLLGAAALALLAYYLWWLSFG